MFLLTFIEIKIKMDENKNQMKFSLDVKRRDDGRAPSKNRYIGLNHQDIGVRLIRRDFSSRIILTERLLPTFLPMHYAKSNNFRRVIYRYDAYRHRGSLYAIQIAFSLLPRAFPPGNGAYIQVGDAKDQT